jgi:type IV pilus assembly protein PilE
MNYHRSIKGLTLIELLVVILIVGILAAVAIPIYRNYMIRARRSDAKTALEQVRASQEMWRAEKGSYSTDGTLVELQTTMGAPANPVGYYNWSFTGNLLVNSFTATATPIAGGPQVTDGALSINWLGVKTPADRWAK